MALPHGVKSVRRKKQMRYIDAYMELKKNGLDDLTYKAEMKDNRKKVADIKGKKGGWMSWEIRSTYIHYCYYGKIMR